MKKILILSTLLSFAMICSCQKQDSTAEAQLAQRKTELDAREEALIQREKAVEARENAVAERERALGSIRAVQPQRHTPDAAQAEAERQKRIQQLPPELQALIPDRSRIEAARAQKEAATQQRAGQTQSTGDDSRKKKMGTFGISVPQQNASASDSSSPSPSATPE
jgi:hypothetical protein